MEQLIERGKRPFLKLLVIILTFVILVDFTIFLINRYIEGLSLMYHYTNHNTGGCKL